MSSERFLVEILETIHAAHVYASTLEAMTLYMILFQAFSAVVASEHYHPVGLLKLSCDLCFDKKFQLENILKKHARPG
jgi:hypothetical protein